MAAYGASGTGKTHTLFGKYNSTVGENDEPLDSDNDRDDESGMIQRLLKQIFESLAISDPALEYTVRISVLEVYLERWRDLLLDCHKNGGGIDNNPIGKSLVRLRSAAPGDVGVTLMGRSAVSCTSGMDAVRILNRALFARTRSATTHSTAATRSTCVVQVELVQRHTHTDLTTVSRLHALDLVASEWIEPQITASSPVSPPVVSGSLKILQEQMQVLSGGQSCRLDPDWPAVTKLVLSSLTGACSANCTFILTASPSHLSTMETANTLRFGADAGNITTTLFLPQHSFVVDRTSTQELAAARIKQDRMEFLILHLATECQRLRDRKTWDRVLWPVIDEILASSSPSSNKNNSNNKFEEEEQTPIPPPPLRKLDFTVETKEEHEVKRERMRHYTKQRKTELERDEATSERDQLRSDVTMLHAHNVTLSEQNAKLTRDITALKRDHSLILQRNRDVEHHLRTSQFRESEAIIFLRQLRRFYYRLLKKTANDGTGEIVDICHRVPGAPDLHQLVDIDHLMMESGLLEVRDVGGDVSMDCRPSRDALERSMVQAQHAEEKAQHESTESTEAETEEIPSDCDGEAGADSGEAEAEADSGETEADVGEADSSEAKADIVHMACSASPPTSIVKNVEPADHVEARQKLYQTPAGKCVILREKLLEEELLQMSEMNCQLRTRLEEERANVEALTDKNGVVGAFDKMRVAQEARLLKEKLKRKDNDLNAVIWKMNELHMVGKTLETESRSREQHVGYLEEILSAAQNQNSINLTERLSEERRLRDEICNLQHQINFSLDSLSSDTAMDRIPLSCRLIVPFTTDKNLESDMDSVVSCGESGEWMNYNFCPLHKMQVEMATQTEFLVLSSATQTDPIDVVLKTTKSSIAVQTDDDDFFSLLAEGITPNTLDNYMFMDSPKRPHHETDAVMPSIGGSTDMLSDSPHQLPKRESGMPKIPVETRRSRDNPERMNEKSDKIAELHSQSELDVNATMVSECQLQSRTSNVGSTATLCATGCDSDTVLFRAFAASAISNPYAQIGGQGLNTDDIPVDRNNDSSTNDLTDFEKRDEKLLSESQHGTNQGGKLEHPPEENKPDPDQKGLEKKDLVKKTDKAPLSSFLDRLQKQSNKKNIDADDKTTTPEFMKMFKKIGGKNQNEAVLETSGAAPARDATRTNFWQVKDTAQISNKPLNDIHAPPLKKWTRPMKKRDEEDSGSDSDDSFAVQFMKGAQPGLGKQVSKTDDPTVTDSESGAVPNSSDSSIGVAGTNQIGGPQVKKRNEDDSDSDSEDSFAAQFMKGAQTGRGKSMSKVDDIIIDRESDDFRNSANSTIGAADTNRNDGQAESESDSSKSESQAERKDENVQPPPYTPEIAAASTTKTSPATQRKRFGRKNDSDSDSDSSDEKRRAPLKPKAIAPAPDTQKNQFTAVQLVRKTDSDSESSDESEAPAKPVAVAVAPGQKPPIFSSSTSTAANKAGYRKDSDYDSDSSDSESKSPIKTSSGASKIQQINSSPPIGNNRRGRKDDSDSGTDSSDDDDKPPSRSTGIVAAAPPTVASVSLSARRVQNKDDSDSSDSDSSDDKIVRKPVTQTATKLVALPTPQISTSVKKSQLDSDDSSDDDDDDSDDTSEDKANAISSRKVTQPPKAMSAVSKSIVNDESSNDDSSDDEFHQVANAAVGLSSKKKPSEIIDLTNRTDSTEDECRLVGGKAANAKPKTKVPDVASKVTSGLSPTRSKGDKESKRPPKAMNTSVSKSITKTPPGSSNKAKYAVRDGKLVQCDEDGLSRSKSSPREKKKSSSTTKEGSSSKVVKKKSPSSSTRDSSPTRKSKKESSTSNGSKTVKPKSSKDAAGKTEKSERKSSSKRETSSSKS